MKRTNLEHQYSRLTKLNPDDSQRVLNGNDAFLEDVPVWLPALLPLVVQ